MKEKVDTKDAEKEKQQLKEKKEVGKDGDGKPLPETGATIWDRFWYLSI